VKIVNVLLVICCFIFSQKINAQLKSDQIKRAGFRYYYKKEIYDKHDLGLALKKDSVAFEFYQRTVDIQKKAKITGIASLSLIGLGAVSIVIGDNSERCNFFSPRTCLAYIVAPLAIAGGLLNGLVSIAMFSDAGIKRNRSVRIFNENVELNRIKDFGNVPIQLDLKIDATKVGLVLNF